MDTRELRAWWDEALNEGIWWAPWGRAIEGLTAKEAAWKPSPQRHSIWDIVNHLTFWQEYFAHRNEGGAPKSQEEVDRLNWQAPGEISEDAWRAAREAFVASHARVRAVMENPDAAPPRPELDLRYLLFHGSYHIGQVMYLRSMLGKAALES